MSFERFLDGLRRGGVGPQALLLLLLCLAAGTWSAISGTDTNWDLRNYHHYTAYAWWHGRLGFDIAPAQMQTFFNPLPSLPYFWLVENFNRHPRLVAFLMGVPAGPYAFALAQIAWIAARRALGTDTLALAAAALVTLLGMTGAAVRPGIGSSMNDVTYAAPIMLALWIALRAAEMPAPRSAWRWRSMQAIGLLCGAAVGIKLTNVMHAAPLGLLVLLLFGLRPALFAGSAMMLAFAAFFGPHALALWREFGSPVFPLYNDIFASPEYLPIRLADERFLPRNLMQVLFYPFYWLRETTGLVTELRMRDPRVAIGLVATLILAAGLLRPSAMTQGPGGRRPILLLLLFWIAAYAMWLQMFGIYRYLLVLESLSGVLLLLALARWLPARRGLTVVVLGAVALFAMLWTVHPNWGRTRHTAEVIRFEPIPVQPGALLLLGADDGLGYIVPFLPPDVRAIGIRNNLIHPSHEHGLAHRIRAAIAAHAGPIWLVDEPGQPAERLADALSRHGLRMGPCRLVRSNLVRAGHNFCEVLRD